jgi:serralysin
VTATILNDDAAPPAPSTLTGTSSNNTLIGTAAADIIYGLGGSDTLYGRAGDDIIDGGAGKDKMYGEQGNDIYYIDHKSDSIVEVAGGGIDTVRTALSSYTLAANVENLEYSGSGSFAGTGNALDNVMRGGSGSDTLNGGLGHDRLFGGSGSDSFNFTSALSSSNIDTILDFNTAADTIRIDNAVFKSFSKTGALASSAFVTGTAAADADDRIIFDRSTGSLFYDADGTGITSAIKFATLDLAGLSGTVTSSDFVII